MKAPVALDAAEAEAGAPARLRPGLDLTGRSDVRTEAWQMLAGLLEATRLMPPALRAPAGSLPLTLLTGFLGAGKTTLLNRLLAEPGGRRLAVLVNDFGRINIDAALVRSRTEQMISLTNGCVCCTVSSDLTRTLIDLAQQEDPPEAIVLEASGVADPRGIAQVALSNPAIRLDGVLTLVDAVAHAEAAYSGTVHAMVDSQIDAADLVVLTKTDEAGPAQADAARRLLAERHGGKPMVTAVHGDLPPDVVLGLHSRRDWRAEPPAPWDHGAAFDTCALQAAQALDRARLERFLDTLPAALLRAKGVLWLAQDPGRRQVYQRVGRRWRLEADGAWGAQAPSSSLVLIAPRGELDVPAVQGAFDDLTRAS